MIFTVQPIPPAEAKPWILKRHYAHRMPCVQYAYGLFDGLECVGVCTFGSSANRRTAGMISGFNTMELNRLIAQIKEPNGLSYFVSRCLKLLPRPLSVVSYADPNSGHVGYIYQATNWIYTGQGTRKNGRTDTGVTLFERDGIEYHAKSVSEMIGSASGKNAKEHGFTRLFTPPKHRYFKFIGSKKEKKAMLDALPYPVLPYPKGETKRYDAEHAIDIQKTLF